MSKLKITVLKRQDPADIFDELPVAKKDWMVPCGIYKDGQEYLLNARTILYGGDLPFFDEKGTAITCCADGMRPVIFKLERV